MPFVEASRMHINRMLLAARRGPVLGVLLGLGLCVPLLGQSSEPSDRELQDRPSAPHLFMPQLLNPRGANGVRSLSLATSTFSDALTAWSFHVPFSNGAPTSSSWGTMVGANTDGTSNLGQSWGYNTAGGEPANRSVPSFDLTIESNYFFAASPSNPVGAHQSEAYLQFIAPDSTLRRPWQVEIPFTGPSAFKTIMFTSTNTFSFLNETSTKQRMKISNYVSLAHNVPLLFSDTNDCAGCNTSVGLVPGDPGQLQVVGNKNGVYGFGNLVANDLVLVGKLTQASTPQNPSIGQLVLTQGSATVVTNKVTQGSRIFLSYAGAKGQLGSLYVAGIQPGVSFQVRSTSATDNSPVNYWIIN
jgi:hypothetical protein